MDLLSLITPDLEKPEGDSMTRKKVGEEADDIQYELPIPIHAWFGLSYASYLVIPRSILQSMSVGWQKRFVALLEECEHIYGGHLNKKYAVNLKRDEGGFVKDDLADYQRGRRFVAPKPYGEA